MNAHAVGEHGFLEGRLIGDLAAFAGAVRIGGDPTADGRFERFGVFGSEESDVVFLRVFLVDQQHGQEIAGADPKRLDVEAGPSWNESEKPLVFLARRVRRHDGRDIGGKLERLFAVRCRCSDTRRWIGHGGIRIFPRSSFAQGR